MGLDISYVSHLGDWQEYDEDVFESNCNTTWRVWHNPGFPGRCSLPEGMYAETVDSKHGSFRAGSYGGYNRWRDALCRAVHGITARQFWASNDPPRAFRELINFSDCEGAIGPLVSQKLSKDFAEFRGLVMSSDATKDMPWFSEVYEKFATAFSVAANGGFVEFM